MLAAVSVVIAEGKRPVSFRTRKLSPPAPMVLHSGGCGRVGRRRTQLMRKPVPPFLWGAGFRCIPGLRGLCRGLRWDGFGRGMAHSGRSGLVPAWAIPRPKPCMAGQQNPALLEESAKARLHRGAGLTQGGTSGGGLPGLLGGLVHGALGVQLPATERWVVRGGIRWLFLVGGVVGRLPVRCGC